MPSLTSPVAAWYRKRREIASRGKNGRTRRVAIMVGVVTALIGAVFMFGPGRDAVADKSSPGVMGGLRSLFSGSADCDYSDAELAWYWCIVYALALLYALVGLAVVCDDFFVASLEIISERLNLSDDVAGATFMAAGSSAPELFTSVVDTFWSENNVGIGTIVGSAVFNILVIIAVSAAASSRPLLIDWRPLTRDCFFYLISIVLLIIFMLPQDDKPRDDCATPPGLVTWPESVLLVVWYALYIVFMVYNQAIFDWVDRKMGKVPDRERRSSTESNASVSAAMRALQMLQLSPEQREAIQRLEEKHKATKFLQDRNVLPNLTPEQRARRRLRSAIISVRLFVHFRKHYIKSPAPAEGGDELVTNALSVGDDAASPSVAAGAGTGAGAGAGAGNDASSQPRSADGEDIVVQIDAAEDPNVGKEVREWLSTRVPPMDRYASKLIEEGFDSLVSVRLLNKEDLLMLGVKNGHCRTLLPEIQKLATELDGASSQAPLPVAVGGVQASGDGASNDDDDEDEEDDSAFGKFICESGCLGCCVAVALRRIDSWCGRIQLRCACRGAGRSRPSLTARRPARRNGTSSPSPCPLCGLASSRLYVLPACWSIL